MDAATDASAGADTGTSPDPLRDQAEALLNQHLPDTTPDTGASTDADADTDVDADPSATDKSGSDIDAMQPLLNFFGIKGDPAAEAETSSPLVDSADDGFSENSNNHPTPLGHNRPPESLDRKPFDEDEALLSAPLEDMYPPGTLSAAKVWKAKTRLKFVGLPHKGKIRYVPPLNWKPEYRLPKGPRSGFLDRFGNEWVKGRSTTAGEAHEWDVQLSKTGKKMLGWISPKKNHLNVSLKGRITHK